MRRRLFYAALANCLNALLRLMRDYGDDLAIMFSLDLSFSILLLSWHFEVSISTHL